MRSKFRTGQLLASGEFLEAVSRPAIIQAIIAHVSRPAHPDRVAFSEHRHGRTGFHLVTAPDRSKTWLWLDEENG